MNVEILRIGDDRVAFHAVVTEQGVTLIDAGLRGDRRALDDALRAVGRSVSDIRGIVLTHGDSDHIGLAEELRVECGIDVFVHEGDADRARGGAKPKPAPSAYRIAPSIGFLLSAMRRGAWRTRFLTHVVPVASGAVLALPGDPEILAVPGHSAGSVAVRVASANALFLGDAVTTRDVLTGRAGVAVSPFTDEPERARRSLESLAHLPESRIFPGHGPEFAGTMADLLAELVVEQ